MNFRHLDRRAASSPQGGDFRAARVKAGLYVYQIAARLRARLRDLHAFEDGRATLDEQDLARLHATLEAGSSQ